MVDLVEEMVEEKVVEWEEDSEEDLEVEEREETGLRILQYEYHYNLTVIIVHHHVSPYNL